MSKNDFCRAFEEAITAEANSLTGAEQLADLPTWDSMAMVAVIAMADAKAGGTLSGSDLRKCKSVEDVWLLLANKESAD